MCKSCLGSYQDSDFLLWILQDRFEHTYFISTMDALDHFDTVAYPFSATQTKLFYTRYTSLPGLIRKLTVALFNDFVVLVRWEPCIHMKQRNVHGFSSNVCASYTTFSSGKSVPLWGSQIFLYSYSDLSRKDSNAQDQFRQVMKHSTNINGYLTMSGCYTPEQVFSSLSFYAVILRIKFITEQRYDMRVLLQCGIQITLK